MSILSPEALLDPKWTAWVTEPTEKVKTSQAMLLAKLGEEKLAQLQKLASEENQRRSLALQEYQETKRKAFAEIGADPYADFKAVQAAYLKVKHPGLKKLLDETEAKQATVAMGSALLGGEDESDYTLSRMLKAKPDLEPIVNQNRPAFEQYVAARHAYLKGAASRNDLALQMSKDKGISFQDAQAELGMMLGEAHKRLGAMRAGLPVAEATGWGAGAFALPPTPETAPGGFRGFLNTLAGGMYEHLAPTLEHVVEKRGGDPLGVRGAIGSTLPRASEEKRVLGFVPANWQAFQEDFAKYGLVEGPLFMAAGEGTAMLKLGEKVAAKVGRGALGKAVGHGIETAATLGAVGAASPATSPTLGARSKAAATGAAAGAVLGPVAGAIGDTVSGTLARKAALKRIEPRKTTRFGEDDFTDIPSTVELARPSTPEAKLAQLETPARVAQEAAAPEEAVKAPTPETPAAESEVIGLNKKEITRIRETTALKELPPAERKTWEATMGRAKEKGLDEKAFEIADSATKEMRPVTDEEHVGMVLKVARLADDYKAAVKEASSLDLSASGELAWRRAETIRDQIDTITKASDQSGREASRTLNIRKMLVKQETYELAYVTQHAQAVKRAKLTRPEIKEFEELTQKHETLQKEYGELETKHLASLAEQERLGAQRVVLRAAKRAQITTRSKVQSEKLLAERESIKKELTALGFKVNDITGATSEASYLVGKLAVNYIRTGVNSLDEVVRLVLNDVPDLAPRDVHRALLEKDPKRIQRARTQTERQVAEIKKQARLLTEVERAKVGVELRSKLTQLRTQAYKSIQDGEKLEVALTKINELQDQLANMKRTKVKGADTPEVTSLKEKLVSLNKEMKLDDVMADLEDQLHTGEFKMKAVVPRKRLPPHLEKKQVEIKLAKQQIRRAIEDKRPIRSASDLAVRATNELRTAIATGDMSAVMRQGLMLSVRRPHVAAKVFVKSLGPTISATKAEEMDGVLRNMPEHYLREKAGLWLPHIGDHRIGLREENFSSTLAERIPGYGAAVKASERHMTTYLNLLRADAFDSFGKKFANATDEELKMWANYVNTASGYGDLGSFTQAAKILSLGFFAPRFAVSRFQTPTILFKYWKSPRVRLEIAKEYAAFGTVMGTTLALAHAAGAEVGLDPRSPDWGKIKIGNTRIDMFAGFQQPSRLMVRLGLMATDRAGLTEDKKKGFYIADDPLELIGSFASYKLSPGVLVPRELVTGTTIVGEPTTPTATMIRAVTPMTAEAAREAYVNDKRDLAKSFALGAASFLGASVSTYPDKKKKKKK